MKINSAETQPFLMFKIRPLFSHLNFGSTYYPERQISVDGSMMPWKGRVSFRQSILSKPIKYRMKIYCCFESSSGYILSMKFNTRAGTMGPEVGHGQQVVKDVTTNYMNGGHIIKMDSFFSTPDLYTSLLKDGTSVCGTIMKNRKGLLKDITAKTYWLQKREHVVRQKGDKLALRYNDRKDVTFLSMAHTGEVINTGKMDWRTQEPIKIPKLIHEYNKHMKGVDQLDQNLSYYSFNRKTMKWWKRAAMHLMHMAKVQSYTLYKK